ncbi:hypothetical protein [Pedobacter panaciterrae]
MAGLNFLDLNIFDLKAKMKDRNWTNSLDSNESVFFPEYTFEDL